MSFIGQARDFVIHTPIDIQQNQNNKAEASRKRMNNMLDNKRNNCENPLDRGGFLNTVA